MIFAKEIFARPQVFRLLEIIPGLMTWGIITLPLWLSPFHPAVAAYFILAFDVYFFYKSATTAILGFISYLRIREAERVNWLLKAKKLDHFDELLHVIILPNYKESVGKLKTTFEAIKKQNFPKKQIRVVLAMEEKEGVEGRNKARDLIKEFGNDFKIYKTYHKLKPGEIAGKASNEAYATEKIGLLLSKEGCQDENVMVTTLDADSLFPENYFSYLTFLYLKDTGRDYHFYHAPVLLYSNFWKLPLPVRVQSTLGSILRMAQLMRPDKLIQVSTYSMGLKLLKSVNFWDRDIIPEDWHLFFQAFFVHGSKVKTVPIFLPIMGDASESTTLLKSYAVRYQQEKRWAWGVTDIPYAIKRAFETPQIPWKDKIYRLARLFEHHIFWPSSFFLLTLAGSIPPLINQNFKATNLGYLLPRLAGLILTLSTAFIVLIIVTDIKARPKRPSSFAVWQTPILFFQWFFLPIISLVFSALPSLEAHTRLMLGKRLEYKVTEKI